MTTLQESPAWESPADALRGFYQAKDWASVEDFLAAHPAGAAELAAAVPAVEAFFPGSPVRLRVQASPDGDGPVQLFADIAVGDDAPAFRQMRQFNGWCAEHLPLDFVVVFDLEFV